MYNTYVQWIIHYTLYSVLYINQCMIHWFMYTPLFSVKNLQYILWLVCHKTFLLPLHSVFNAPLSWYPHTGDCHNLFNGVYYILYVFCSYPVSIECNLSWQLLTVIFLLMNFSLDFFPTSIGAYICILAK